MIEIFKFGVVGCSIHDLQLIRQYIVNFFIDSMSIFLSSLGLSIRIIIYRNLTTLQSAMHEVEEKSFEKTNNISTQEISLPQKIKRDENANSNDYAKIVEENKFIKRQNQIMKKQLQTISQRLDLEIQKRIEEVKKKTASKTQEVEHMELLNAYKKCQIYKKEVKFYRKKLESIGQSSSKLQQFDAKFSELTKQNNGLKDELKNAKKIMKLQQKGLSQIGAEGFLKLTSENDNLKEQLRKLKKQLDEQRRIDSKRYSNVQGTRFTSQNERFSSSRNIANSKNLNITKIEDNIKKRIKSQKEQNNDDLLDLLQQKVEKDYMKIKTLASQKNKLREMLDNLKYQLAEKDKQIHSLKQKINQLRKNNQFLKIHSEKKQGSDENSIIRSKSRQSNLKIQKKTEQSIPSVAENEYQSKNQSEIRQDFTELQINEIKLKNNRYPRLQEEGKKEESTIKWNHHQFSSKIKEIQILPHEQGFIKDIHVRYQKGQPKKYESNNGKYSVFACSEMNEYIKYISGGFANGYLQYLIVTTNTKRTSKYCKFELEKDQSCQNFRFKISEDQYPCALFGQNDSQGVRRLGCLIQKE